MCVAVVTANKVINMLRCNDESVRTESSDRSELLHSTTCSLSNRAASCQQRSLSRRATCAQTHCHLHWSTSMTLSPPSPYVCATHDVYMCLNWQVTAAEREHMKRC
jgi:hypothetical protein